MGHTSATISPLLGSLQLLLAVLAELLAALLCCRCGGRGAALRVARARLTPALFGPLLGGAAPRAVELEDLAAVGATSVIYRVTLSYGEGAGAVAPRTLICKVLRPDLQGRVAERLMALFVREALAYHHFHEDSAWRGCSARLPRVYMAAGDLVVMEDLGRPGLRAGDSFLGVAAKDAVGGDNATAAEPCSPGLRADLLTLAREVARVHGFFWGAHARVRALDRFIPLPSFHFVWASAPRWFAKIVSHSIVGTLYSAEHREVLGLCATPAAMGRLWARIAATDPASFTLVHNDLRLDNCFIDDGDGAGDGAGAGAGAGAGGGGGAAPSARAVLLDWQNVLWARPAVDLVHMLLLDVPVGHFDELEPLVFAEWRAAAAAHGVSAAYLADEAQVAEDVRQAIMLSLVKTAFILTMLDAGSATPRVARLITRYALNMNAAMRRWKVLQWVRAHVVGGAAAAAGEVPPRGEEAGVGEKLTTPLLA
jgi:hypothetical protein